MAQTTRISEAELARFKTIPVKEHAEQKLGVVFTGQGANQVGRCPLPGHEDKTPSFVVTPSNNLWHCLGKCNKGGSIIDLVQITERAGFRRAIEILRQEYSHLLGTDELVSQSKSAIDLSGDNQKLTNQAIAYFNSQIGETRPYLASRGLDDQELIDRFQIGFSNRTLGYHLPIKQVKAGKDIRTRLIELGLLRESGHETFAGSLVIPIFDEDGNVVGIYGRKVTTRLREGTPLHLYLKGKHRGVWNWQGLINAQEVILCEALIDALTFYKAGFHNVTSSYGVNGFTEDHLIAFKKYNIKRVLIAYDRDEAGDRAAQELADRLSAENIECLRIEFPINTDANEFARQYQPTTEKWLELLAQARQLNEINQSIIADEVVEQIETIEEDHQPIETAPAQSSIESTATTLPSINIPVERRGDDIIIRLGDRFYRVRNLQSNNSYGQLKVNLLCGRGDQYHLDTIDLCLARQRKEFIKAAADELGIKDEIIKKDLGKVLLKLEELQDEMIRKVLTPAQPTITLTESEREAALTLLKAPNLLQRIISDFHQCGVVGEETNKLVAYLSTVSRKLDRPLAIIIQSSSAAGKSSLMEAVLEMIPAEERVKYSAMTGQSLYYLGQKDLKHKVLAIVEQQGAQEAAYSLKLLQSEGELTIASTGKDQQTGRLVTHEYRVEGPVMIFITTTAIDIDEELKNRCLVLTVNESREQTRLIHQLQRERETLDGLWAADEHKEIIRLHQNAQRLLKPIAVVNPYAKALTFLDDQTRLRRDHTKYLKLIKAIALLHQYQRPIKTDARNGEVKQYIEVNIDDIEMANRLANEVMGRCLDELSPQTRRFLLMINEMVMGRCEELQVAQTDYRFTQRDVREFVGWSDFQVKTHLRKLVEMEYLIVHRGGRGQQFVYELLYQGEGQQGQRFLMGLINVESLRAKFSPINSNNIYDRKWEHRNSEQELSGSIEVATREHPGSSGHLSISASINEGFISTDNEIMKNAYIRGNGKFHQS